MFIFWSLAEWVGGGRKSAVRAPSAERWAGRRCRGNAPSVDFGAAAVHEHRADANGGKEDEVADDTLLRRRCHGTHASDSWG